MAENPTPEPTSVNPTPPPAGPAPFNYAAPPPGGLFAPAPDQDAKTMGMLAHLLGIFTNWLGPLIIWLIKREQSPFVNDQGKEALNWQLTVFIAYFVLGVSSRMLPALIGCFLSIIVFGAWVINVVFVIQASIAASKGIAYRYPFSLRLVK